MNFQNLTILKYHVNKINESKFSLKFYMTMIIILLYFIILNKKI